MRLLIISPCLIIFGRFFMKKFLLGALMLLTSFNANASDIDLVKPDTTGGMPLLDAISARRTGRQFADKMLSDKDLSTLLWTAWGYSSEDERRVVPTARNLQDMDLYVATKDGWYLYDAKQNKLIQKGDKDLRVIIAHGQNFAESAPVHLLFVTKDKKYGEVHAGSMYENTSLYCASAKLQCVVRAWYDKAELKEAMGLEGELEVVMTFAAGYPAE